jgi:hypothetical protein
LVGRHNGLSRKVYRSVAAFSLSSYEKNPPGETRNPESGCTPDETAIKGTGQALSRHKNYFKNHKELIKTSYISLIEFFGEMLWNVQPIDRTRVVAFYRCSPSTTDRVESPAGSKSKH